MAWRNVPHVPPKCIKKASIWYLLATQIRPCTSAWYRSHAELISQDIGTVDMFVIGWLRSWGLKAQMSQPVFSLVFVHCCFRDGLTRLRLQLKNELIRTLRVEKSRMSERRKNYIYMFESELIKSINTLRDCSQW